MKWNAVNYIDLIFCIVLLPILFLLLPIERWYANNPIFVSLLLVWFYIVYFVNRRFTVPLFFQNRPNYWLASLLLAASFLITYLIASYQLHIPVRRHLHGCFPPPARFFLYRQAVWFLFLIVLAFSFAVGLLPQLFSQTQARKEAEYERKKAELALYKAQINPHFLFNTLNTLYGMIIARSPRTESAFMQFIDLMRYQYTLAMSDKITVENEYNYLKQYVALQKMRLSDMTTVEFNYSDSCNRAGQLQIAPMLLITFVENAFKYGVSTHEPSYIRIDLRVDENDCLFFSSSNKICRTPDKEGIGIRNCRQRLRILYPDAHGLKTEKKDGEYNVRLQIKLS